MVNSKIIAAGILRAIGVLVLAAISLYFLYLIQSILIYLVVALILTLIRNQILDFFKNSLKFKHTLATIVTLLIFILFIASFVMMFIPLISSQGENLALLKTAEIEKNITQLLNQTAAFRMLFSGELCSSVVIS